MSLFECLFCFGFIVIHCGGFWEYWIDKSVVVITSKEEKESVYCLLARQATTSSIARQTRHDNISKSGHASAIVYVVVTVTICAVGTRSSRVFCFYIFF